MDKTIFAIVGRLPPLPLLSVSVDDPDLDTKFHAVKLKAISDALASGARMPLFEVK